MSIPKTAPTECFYFGCIGSSGHYPFKPSGSRIHAGEWREWLMYSDGRYYRGFGWLRHIFQMGDGSNMTVISKADNSVDSRPGSSATFFMAGELSLEDAVLTAKKAWPQLKVWNE